VNIRGDQIEEREPDRDDAMLERDAGVIVIDAKKVVGQKRILCGTGLTRRNPPGVLSEQS
jgi:hypothetical protein